MLAPRIALEIRPLSSLLLLAVIPLFLAAAAFAERLPLSFYSTADGLGSSAVNDIMRDSRGFLWYATRDGLSRYDGFKFNNYKMNAAGTADTIVSITERRNGDYILVTQSSGILRFNAATAVSEPANDGSMFINADRVFDRNVERFLEDRDGSLWIVLNGRVIALREENGRFVETEPIRFVLPDGSDSPSVFSFIEDRAGTFWLSTDRGLVRLDKKGRVLAFYSTPRPTAMRTYLVYLFADREGRIWIESRDGLFVLIPEAATAESPPVSQALQETVSHRMPANPGEITRFDKSDGLLGNIRPAFHQQPDGRIWIASDAGLLLFENDRFRFFGSDNGIGEYLLDITDDAGGNLWIGSLSGVYRIVLNGLTTFTKTDGLGRTSIAALYENQAGDLFATQDEWIVSRFDGQKFVTGQAKLTPNAGAILWTSNVSLLDSRGSWWFISENFLNRYDNVGKVEELAASNPAAVVPTGPEFNNGAFYRLFEDSRGDVWASLRSVDPEKMGLAVWRHAEKKFIHFGEADGFPSRRSPSAFCEDSYGNLWIGFYYGGIARYRDGKFTVLDESDGFPSGFITSIFRDQLGRIWIATSVSGVHVVDDPAAEKPKFRAIQGLSSNNARAIADDLFGRIYIGTVRGVDRVSVDTNEIYHFSMADGLADDFVTVAKRDRSGAVWFGTRNGLSRLIPKPDVTSAEPPILIAGVRIAGEKQSVSELGATEVAGLDLKNSQNNLQIDFFSVGRATLDQTRFQYKLEGADTDWSKPTTERSVNYSNLAAGDYRFLVRAMNSQGLASSVPASVVFRIAPPVWRTWWFSLFVLMLAVAILYFVLNQRFRRVLELEKVRTRIATDLHDDIGASLSRISMLSEIVKSQSAATDPVSQKRLSQIAGEARGLVESMSDIVWAINPRRDSIESVVDRVCSFAADTLGTKDVGWTVSAPPELKHLHLTAEEKRNLYLIFKEAVNNAARHSKCTSASLKIRMERGELVAEIADDGIGFAPNLQNGNSLGGRGLVNMRTRAAEIKGKIDFVANKPRGTVIVLSLPLRAYRFRGRIGFFVS